MPLSFGIPLGILVIVIGGIFFLSTKYKRSAKLVMGIGLFIAAITLILIVLALTSNM